MSLSSTQRTIQFFTEKGPEESLDYTIDYTELLALVTPADTIITSDWTAEGEGTIDRADFTTEMTTIWLTGGGRIGDVTRLYNVTTTAGGRTHRRLIKIKMVNRLAEPPETNEALI